MVTAIVSAFSGVILMLIGWLLGGKQKASAEIKKANADATVTIQSMFDTFTIQYQKQYDNLLKEVNELKQDKINYKNLAEHWEQKFNDLQKEFDKLKKSIK